MVRQVTITFPIDTQDYVGVEENDASVTKLVYDMIIGEADWPDEIVGIAKGSQSNDDDFSITIK